MKFHLYCIAFFLFSCSLSNNDQEKKAPASDTTAFNWELEDKKMQRELELKRKDFIFQKRKKSYEFICYDLCKEGVGVSEEDRKKYWPRKPIDIQKTTSTDTLTIKFKFLADCCLEFIGDVEKRNDTLNLSYKNISYTPCDCHCYYYYLFQLPLNKYKTNVIILGDSTFNAN